MPPTVNPSQGSGPLDTFFRTYNDFPYDPRLPPKTSWNLLKKHRGWRNNSRKGREAQEGFYRAIEAEFRFHLERADALDGFTRLGGVGDGDEYDDSRRRGKEDDDTQGWWKLCVFLDLRLQETGAHPETKTACKKCLENVWINIFDFIDHLRNGSKLRRFPNLRELSAYSYKRKKVFGLDEARNNEILKHLLKPISRPRGRKGNFGWGF